MHPIVNFELQRVLRGLNTIVINPLIAELLRTEGRPAEPPTLENKESSTIIIATAFQGKLSAEQYNLTISQAQGGSLSRSRVFLSCLLTRDWSSIGPLAQARLSLWKRREYVQRQNFGAN